MALHAIWDMTKVGKMASADNISYLNQTSSDSISQHVLMKKLLGTFKDTTRQHMRRVMQNMFDNADDALFKMAENAGQHDDQNLYLDSMRIVRLKKSSIENNFFELLENEFERHLNDESGAHQPQIVDTDNIDFDSLSLISEEDLEITLAKDRLIQKIHATYSQDLSAISKRFAHLQDKTELDDTEIPFGAQTIVATYSKAVEKTDLALEIRIILFKLFDLQCIHGLAGLYQSINQQFIDAGVLPVIKTSIKHMGPPGSAPPAAPNAPQSDEAAPYPQGAMPEGGGGMWGTLQGLMTQYRETTGGYYPAPGYTSPEGYAGAPTGMMPAGMPMGNVAGQPAGGMVGGNSMGGPAMPGGATVLSSNEMLSSLTSLQQNFTDEIPQGGAHAVGNYVRVQLQNPDNDADAQRHITPLDNDLIDVVCLIFEYILNDPQLPAVATASIARLQIPMLKVAMLDKEFFSINGHPARNLLNKLAQSAIGIDEATDADNPILQKIHDITETVLEEFTDDISLFENLHDQFNQFLTEYHAQEAQAIVDIEQQLKEREELALAKAWVKETLEQHLLGRELPTVIVDIILGPWKDVMLQTYLQEGEHSTLWKTQIRFIDVLCWSIEPKQLSLDKNKLGHIIQKLITTLREGLIQINYPENEIDGIFDSLEPYHIASVRGHEHKMDMDNAGEAELIEATIQNIETEYQQMQDEQPVTDNFLFAPSEEEAETTSEELMSSDDDDYDEKIILEDITLAGWESDPEIESINDEYLALARHLEMGKWVEFKNKEGKSQRAKLAWKSDLLGEFTFLNWKFDVVADKSLLELADDLRQGNAKVVDDVPLMDRALSAVLTTLTPKAARQ